MYRFDRINDLNLLKMNKIPYSKIPLIFKNFDYIWIYDGKINKKIHLKFTNITNK